MELEFLSRDTMPEPQFDGKLVLRFRYPDGRLSAIVTVDNDWQVKVFANELAARAFALEFNLQIEEQKSGDETT